MTYVETLRVRRALIVYAIINAAMVAFTLLVSFTAHGGAAVSAEAHSRVDLDLRQMLAADFARHGTKIPLSALFLFAGFGATIMGTVWGSTLSREREHTPLSWTKPVSRDTFALGYLGIDALGMLGAFAITMLAIGIVLWALNIAMFTTVDAQAGLTLARAAGLAFAYYGLIRVLTVGFPGRGGAITGASWAIAYVLLGLAALPLPKVYHVILIALNFINPLAYLSHMDSRGNLSGVLPLMPVGSLAGVWLLAIVTGILAIVIYRRAEA